MKRAVLAWIGAGILLGGVAVACVTYFGDRSVKDFGVIGELSSEIVAFGAFGWVLWGLGLAKAVWDQRKANESEDTDSEGTASQM